MATKERYLGQLDPCSSPCGAQTVQIAPGKVVYLDRHRPPKPPLIYVSGPLTTGQLTANVRAALDVGKLLIERGYAVVVPHEKLITEILHPMSYDEWLAYDFRIILCCDAVYRMPGESKGAEAEVEFALQNGIPVYPSLDSLFACERVTAVERR